MHYALFDTAIGPCGVAWSAQGLARMQLPGADARDTALRLRRFPGLVEAAPTPPIARAIAVLQAHMRGEATDFSGVQIDLEGFDAASRQVYQAARGIGWGETLSYGELARRAGLGTAAREVGIALARNRIAIIVPCHRIIAAGDRLGGFSAYGGQETKRKLLELEGVRPGAPVGQGCLF
jgi:methylated-DNA-[protein]-cysteine S-methyltransferase